MSRAFVREGDGDDAMLPERRVSPHPNFVTASGLAQIDSQVRSLEAARLAAREAARDVAQGAHDAAALATIERDLRYWTRRKATARLIVPAAEPDVVRFGTTVTLHAADGAERRLRIVGEDEADPARGLVSWVSPVAESLLGAVPGEEVEIGGVRYAIARLAGEPVT
ncbi:MAG: GreA/GreB family elongation factor [Steroidobacteraceae bacterium]|nr:GreA/GreB family elongation factor [Steroidobacteraceae bacterium]